MYQGCIIVADLDQKMRAADAMQIQDPSRTLHTSSLTPCSHHYHHTLYTTADLECTTVIVSLNPFVTKRVCDKTALLDMNEFANAMDGK